LIKVFVSHATLGHALVLAGATEKAPHPTSAPTFLTKVSLERYERFDRTATVIAYDVGGLQGEEHLIGEVSFTLSEFAARSDASAANNAQAGGQPQPVEFTLQRVVEHQDGTSSREDVAGAVVRISDVTLRAGGSATARGRQSAVESPRSAGADGQLADAAEGALENIQEQQQAEQIAAALNAAAAAPAAAVPEPIEASAVAPASKKGSAAGSRAASRTGSSTGAAVVAAAAAAAGSSSKPSSRPVSRPGSSIGGPKSPGSPKKTASRPGSGVKAQPAGTEAATEQPRLSRPVSASQKLAANLEKKDAEVAAAAIAEAQARQEAATPASAVADSALSAREHAEQAHDVTAGPAAAAGATAEMPAPEAHASATAVDAAAE
jgi:hypothetical protein